MKRNIKQALSWLGLSEGGYVDDPKDPGGPTNHGVTERVWHAYQRNNDMPMLDVRKITPEIAAKIFAEQYFTPVWFDKLPSGLDYCQGDFSVNSGPSRATTELQEVLVSLDHTIAIDGHMGHNTLAAIKVENIIRLIVLVCERRLAFMKRLKHWQRFKSGWTIRVNGVEKRATELTKAKVADPLAIGPDETQGRATGKPINGLLQIILLVISALFGVKL